MSQSTYVQKPVTAEISAMFVTADALCGSHAFQHKFQVFVAQRFAPCHKILVSIESPDGPSLFVEAIR
jgi:hypothetical protein